MLNKDKKRKTVLELKNLHLTYHSKNGETQALEKIDLEVKEGELIGILGPSGCGKTTILSLISGLIKPSAGEVLISGKTVNKKDGKVGYMFQKDHLFEWRTILQNVCLGLDVKKNKSIEAVDSAKDMLKKYGLLEFSEKYPNQLSGGMRQRVALFRTLVLNPELLLLDEPFSALDYQNRLLLCEDVRNIIKSENKTSVLVTHDIAEAISMCDRIVVLSKRPATIKKTFDLSSLSSFTSLERRKQIEFQQFFDEIYALLQN